MSKRKDKGRQPPWISVFRHTWKSAAWKVLSISARALYVELAANYNTKMQNSVFISARDGSERLNVGKDSITVWLRELEHYGFTVKVRGHFLGLDGEGKAKIYRLTDRWYAGKEPAYDFQNWNGVLFEPPKRKRPASDITRLRHWKKQNPVPRVRTPRPACADISDGGLAAENGNKCPDTADISDQVDCPHTADITSVAISEATEKEMSKQRKTPKPAAEMTGLMVWSTPVLTEVFGEEATRLRLSCEEVDDLPDILEEECEISRVGADWEARPADGWPVHLTDDDMAGGER